MMCTATNIMTNAKRKALLKTLLGTNMKLVRCMCFVVGVGAAVQDTVGRLLVSAAPLITVAAVLGSVRSMSGSQLAAHSGFAFV